MNNKLEITQLNFFLVKVALLFFLIVWIFNPSNLMTLLLSIILLVLIYFNLKNITKSAFYVYLITSILPVGKEYIVVLRTLNEFPLLRLSYPFGLTATIAITVSDMIFAIFFLGLLINLRKNTGKIFKEINLGLIDILIIALFSVGLVTDLYISRQPFFSFIFKKGLFECIVIYFFIRIYANKFTDLFFSVFSIFASLIFFESFMAIQQFIISAPLGKNFEIYHTLAQFGGPADELAFTFRPIGTFSHANDLAIFIASLMPIFFYYLIFIKKTHYFIFLIFFLGIGCLIMTLSRSSWIALSIGIAYFLFTVERRLKINLIKRLKTKSLLIFLIGCIPLLTYSFPRIARSIYSFDQSGGFFLRIRQIKESLELFLSYPLTGVGTGMSVVEALARNKTGVFSEFPSPVHNYYALLLVENGLPGILLLLTISLLAIRKISTGSKPYSFAVMSSLLVIIFSALFQPFFNFQLFFILIGFIFAKIGSDVSKNQIP